MRVQLAQGSIGAEQFAFDRAMAARDATMFALANGAIGVRGAIEELDDQHAIFVPEAYVRRPIRYHESFPGFAASTDTRLTGPGITAMRIAIDGELIDFSAAEALTFNRVLDVARAVLRRTTRWRLVDGREIVVEAQRIVPFDQGAVCLSRIVVKAINFAGRLSITCPIGEAVQAGAADESHDPRINARTTMVSAAQWPTDHGWAARFYPADADGPPIIVEQWLCPQSNALVDGVGIEGDVRAGQGISFDRFTAVQVGSDAYGALPQLDSTLQALVNAGFPKLARAQATRAAAFQSDAHVAITGDQTMEQAIRGNLFHLIQSASRSPDVSIAAKGLTGEGYEGHYFWDTEAFVAPVLALIQPDLCRNLILYRVGKLSAARANALAIGHQRGALFPWRTIGGSECSAHYPTGSAQYHINAAIAFALESYEQATADLGLVDQAAEMLFETARLWFDIGHFSARRGGAFVIHGVTGPDEYTALVDNDFYTNAMARRHLRYAVATAQRMATSDSPAYGAIADAINLTADEIAGWSKAAAHMWLPVDAATGVHPQDDSFLDKPRADLSGHDPAQGPMLLRMHPMLLFRQQICKQGDILQAHCTAGMPVSQAQIARDFDYYEPITTHDSTLSSAAFATLAARLGDDGKALTYHRMGALVDFEDLHGNTSHGVHMAAMAGSWLTLVQGWGGLTTDGGILRLAPHCPDSWSGYAFRLRWRGSLIHVDVTASSTTYRLCDGGPVSLLDHGRPIELANTEVETPRPHLRGVIFDLDGVLTDTAEAHFHAWKRLCDEEGLPFDRAFNEQLKGVDRDGSLRLILTQAGRAVSAEAFDAMTARKNGYYQQAIANYGPDDLFPGARELLEECLRAGLRIGLASASRNAPALLSRLGISALFDHVTDPATLSQSKPDPEIFVATAHAMGLDPAECIGIEDASAGIAAIRAAGMPAIGIGDPIQLSAAQHVAPVIAAITVADLHSIAAVTAAAHQIHLQQTAIVGE